MSYIPTVLVFVRILAYFTVWLLAHPCSALTCIGDCNRDDAVRVDEVVVGVNIALDRRPLDVCRFFDRSGNNAVEVDELVTAVTFVLNGCPRVPTETLVAQTATSTPRRTPTDATVVPPTSTPTPTLPATHTIALTPTATATDPPVVLCAIPTTLPLKPPHASACVPVPGMFVDCFASSGLDVDSYADGENGAAVADVDGDSFPDVFFWNTAGVARLFRNVGHDMQFEEVADASFNWPEQTTVVGAAFGDLDNDGKPDLVVAVDRTLTAYRCSGPGTDPLNTFRVYRNLGTGKFAEVTEAWGFGQTFAQPEEKPVGVGFSLTDLNLDGRLDIVLFRRSLWFPRPLAFLSQPDGRTWTEAGLDVFGEGRGLTWNIFFTDANHDQLVDAFILNDFYPDGPSRYYERADRSLRYVQRSLPPVFVTPAFGSPMGAATGDLNGDGELDLVVSDSGDQHVFSQGINVEDAWGVKQNPSRYGIQQTCWSIAVLDLENDGTPDLFFACAGFRIGFPDRAASFVLRNVGGRFEVAEGVLPDEDIPTWDEGLAVADFDQDGRLDLFTGGEEHPPRLLWNQLPGGHALAIRLKGRGVNAEGVGARVEVEAPGLPRQVRELFPGGTTWGYGDSQLLFGVGEASHVTVTVDWRPAGGTVIQTVEATPGSLRIEEPQ